MIATPWVRQPAVALTASGFDLKLAILRWEKQDWLRIWNWRPVFQVVHQKVQKLKPANLLSGLFTEQYAALPALLLGMSKA
jgi:hypothetical protein